MKRKTLKDCRRTYVIFVLTLFVMAGWCTGAWALHFDIGPDAALEWETTLTYGLGMRVADQSKSSINADINGDDGNRSFEQWDLVNNRGSILTEADLHKGGFGLFVRAAGFYDFVYMGDSEHDNPATHNAFAGNGGSLNDHQDFSDDVEDSVGRNVELLDAYVYADFDVADNPTTVRVGRQVVNWGESLFLIGGIGTSQNPLDATKANTPGAELRELFLPTGQVYAQQTLFDTVTFTGFYKWEWDKTRFDEAGTFFSTSDILLEGAESILFDAGVGQNLSINHRGDKDARDDGQWGLGTRYYAEDLNGAEFGLFYMNYHENIPMAKSAFPGGSLNTPGGVSWTNFIASPDGDLLDYIDGSIYYFEYAEDVQLLGLSAAGQVGAASLGLEVAYRWDYPVEIIDANPLNVLGTAYEESEILHIVVNGMYLWGDTLLSDTGTLIWELGFDQAYGISTDMLSYDKTAWGGAVQVVLEYLQILDGLDLTVPITYMFNPDGTSSYVGSFDKDADSLGIAFNFTYNAVWKFDLSYTDFLNDTDKNLKGDRDWLGFNMKYTF
jgi:hypothetical protein